MALGGVKMQVNGVDSLGLERERAMKPTMDSGDAGDEQMMKHQEGEEFVHCHLNSGIPGGVAIR